MKTAIVPLFIIVLSEGKGFLNWLQNHLLTCPIKHLFGIDCPGCGMQRSFLALMRGDVSASLKFHPAALPLLVLVAFTLVHLKVDFKFGALLIKMLFIGIAIIIVIKYIYKIYNHQLLN